MASVWPKHKFLSVKFFKGKLMILCSITMIDVFPEQLIGHSLTASIPVCPVVCRWSSAAKSVGCRAQQAGCAGRAVGQRPGTGSCQGSGWIHSSTQGCLWGPCRGSKGQLWCQTSWKTLYTQNSHRSIEYYITLWLLHLWRIELYWLNISILHLQKLEVFW